MDKYNVKLVPFTRVSTLSELDFEPTGITQIRAREFWNIEPTKGKGIKIAILDTGCDVNHPDLVGRIAGVRNFTSDDRGAINIVTDRVGHGTHVAGTISGNENGSGVVGVAPNASLYILKVLTEEGGTIEDLIKAINYAVTLKVDIISMSLGTTVRDIRLYYAILRAVGQNISIVCAAGNSGDNDFRTDEKSYPAAFQESICVGSMDSEYAPSFFTNSNDKVDLVAPGEEVVSTYPGGRYAVMSGTSMATPHVTGALALLKNWAKKNSSRKLTELDLYNHLIRKTVDIPYDARLVGFGALNLMTNQG
ncbi:MAG: S8 family peptidase [Clostridium sp.]